MTESADSLHVLIVWSFLSLDTPHAHKNCTFRIYQNVTQRMHSHIMIKFKNSTNERKKTEFIEKKTETVNDEKLNQISVVSLQSNTKGFL